MVEVQNLSVIAESSLDSAGLEPPHVEGQVLCVFVLLGTLQCAKHRAHCAITVQLSSHLILTTAQEGWCSYYPHFIFN